MNSVTDRTPKEKVLRKVPTAYATKGSGYYAGMWVIRDLANKTNVWSNHCHTAAAAWREALKHVPQGPTLSGIEDASDTIAGTGSALPKLAQEHPLATQQGLELMIAGLFHIGAMCPKCGFGTRRTSERWARCKKCWTRVERRELPK